MHAPRRLALALSLAACNGNTTGDTSQGTSLTSQGETTATPTSSSSAATSTSNPTTSNPTTSNATTSNSTDPGTTTAPSTSDTSDTATTGDPLPPGARRFRFTNNCAQTIWVASIGNPVAPPQNCDGDESCGPDQVCNPGNMLCTWAAPDAGGFELPAGQTHASVLPPAWGGRFWGRTGCVDFNANGVPACQTGDCGGHLDCPAGVGGSPPATLAEFTLIPPDQPVGLDFYDISAVDGTNLAMRIDPVAGSFAADPPPAANIPYYCTSPGCTQDCGALAPCPWNIDSTCPPELQQLVNNQQVGCRSAGQACAIDPNNPPLACAATNDLYGCTGGGPNDIQGSCYSNNAAPTCCGCPGWSPPGACTNNNPKWQLPASPEKYARVFKDACPTAYSFPYDDPTSTFTCQGRPEKNVDYEITFCP